MADRDQPQVGLQQAYDVGVVDGVKLGLDEGQKRGALVAGGAAILLYLLIGGKNGK